MEGSTPLPGISASSPSASSAATVGSLLTKAASGGVTPRECRSPRSILSRILRRSGSGGGGFGCRLRLPIYCSTGRAAKEDDGEEVAAPPCQVVGGREEVRVSPPRSSDLQEKKQSAAALLPASLGLGASLVMLMSRSAAELSRMAELRAEMERLVLDAKADARGSCDRSNASDHTDVKEPIVLAGGEDVLSHGSPTAARDAGVGSAGAAMDQMEAELEAELTRLQLASNEQDEAVKSDAVPSNSHSTTCADNGSVTDDDGAGDDDGHDGHEDDGSEEEQDDDGDDQEEKQACHGGVPARVLERRLHELLRSRHEERIAELESELERARRKLQEKEREVSRWRDTAKLASRHRDRSQLR